MTKTKPLRVPCPHCGQPMHPRRLLFPEVARRYSEWKRAQDEQASKRRWSK